MCQKSSNHLIALNVSKSLSLSLPLSAKNDEGSLFGMN